MVLLCGLSSFICYADRVNITVAVLHMGLGRLESGWVLASFFYGYFCTQIVGGLLAARCVVPPILRTASSADGMYVACSAEDKQLQQAAITRASVRFLTEGSLCDGSVASGTEAGSS